MPNSHPLVSSSRFYNSVCGPFVGLLLSICMPSLVLAQGVRGVMDDLVRGTARVADDIPVKKVDDLVAELSRSRSAREAVDAELLKSGRLAGVGDAVHNTARSNEVLRLLRSATANLDPEVIRRIEQLDDSSRDVALCSPEVEKSLRGRCLILRQEGDCCAKEAQRRLRRWEMYGPDAARAALRLDEAIRSGFIIVKDGGRVVTLADFGCAMTHFGNGSWRFWKEYVQPHWKIWATSGALAAYITNPEYFQDTAGKLTEAGFRHLTEFAGVVAASAVRGVGKGSGTATEKVIAAVRDTFFDRERGIYAMGGTLIFLLFVSLLFRRIRYWLLRPFRWLNRTPT